MDLVSHKLNRHFEWHQGEGPYTTITEAQARAYRDVGGFVFEDAFTRAEIDEILAALDPLHQTANDQLESLAPGTPTISRADQIVFNAHLVTQSEVARRFARHPIFVGICRDLIGGPVRLYWDQLVYKHENPAEFPWHQDNGYTFVEPQQYLTCWVALTEATVANGCPAIAPGLHRRGTLRHEWTDIGFRCLPAGEASAHGFEELALPLKAGSIAVFSSLTPHRTGPNVTHDTRKAYILQYAPDGAIVHQRGGPTTLANDAERQFLVTE